MKQPIIISCTAKQKQSISALQRLKTWFNHVVVNNVTE